MPPRAKKTVKKMDGGKRHPLNVRTTFEARQRLESAAMESGRSLTQEAEVRIERTFKSDDNALDALELIYGSAIAGLALALADCIQQSAVSTRLMIAGVPDGDGWLDDPTAFDQAIHAINTLMDGLRPDGDPRGLTLPDGFAAPGTGRDIAAMFARGDMGRNIGKRKLAVVAGNLPSPIFKREEIQQKLLAQLAHRALANSAKQEP
ncbi:TraY domain-containing protein [Tardiphaga robiniae]|uniref:TraY domain-containing protein n=1 Tax=Tardiphaga robiniae TaxID=943830 RepID=UPI0015868DB4|nr:TraY domain-containing protein [Tardiphaga robiniae]NUU39627.1 TraY domain-containing protein [Tardiphaga robiniae]